ncbi:MAG: helix-turn-helix transcriptional regulator [Chloroflexi bacterium]|nr:helix-turn-helix transcriptional regulator [Chloroflexota bacterium]
MAQVCASAIDADRCDVDCLRPDHVRPLLGRSLGGDRSRRALGMSVSALSQQLRALRARGAVDRRRDGRIACDGLVDDHLRRLVLHAAVHVAEGLT